MNNILPSRHNMQLKNLLCVEWLNNLIYLYIKNIADRTNNLNLSGAICTYTASEAINFMYGYCSQTIGGVVNEFMH
jgi:hypothetical protein